MDSQASLALGAACMLSVPVGCGPEPRACRVPAEQDGACPSNSPPTRLVLDPATGIPGQYTVVLALPVPNIDSATDSLARKYSGRVTAVYADALCGFTVQIPDASAAELSAEAQVCYVQQDSKVGGF